MDKHTPPDSLLVALPKTDETKNEHEHTENNANQDFVGDAMACGREM